MKRKTNSLTLIALQKFKKNKIGVFSFWYIIICGFVAILAYVLAPDNSSNANQMHIEIHTKKPGFEVLMLTIPSKEKNKQPFFKTLLYGKTIQKLEIPISSYTTSKNNLNVQLFAETSAESLSKIFPLSLFPKKNVKPFIKSKKFYLGTDKYGRDLLSRMLIGTRISFFIGFIAVFISLVIGIFMGAISGYFGGILDTFIMWLINITWVEVARIVRGQILSVKKMQYVEAAKALGFSNFRIIFRHILPNILAPIIVISAANFAAAILIESGLSFLGIGAQPPTPSWGAMIKDHYNYIILGKAYLAVIPGLAIMSLVMAFMMIGNALRDALDVKN